MIRYQKPVSGIERFLRSTTLVYGAPKIGKTTFVSTFPDVLIIEAEPGGADYIEGWVAEVSSLDELRTLWKELRRRVDENNFPWKTIALDTIDAIADWLAEEIALEFGRKDLIGPSQAFGAEWAKLRAAVLDLVKQFTVFPAGLVVIAHSKGEGEKATVNLPGKLARALMAAMNNIIYLSINENGERMCIAAPSLLIEAGSRDPYLLRISPFPPNFQELKRRYEAELAREMEKKDSAPVGEEEAEKTEVKGRRKAEKKKDDGNESKGAGLLMDELDTEEEVDSDV